MFWLTAAHMSYEYVFFLQFAVLSLGSRDHLEIAPILGVLVGVVTALLLVTVVILGALKVRATHRESSQAHRPGFLPVKGKITLPLRSESEDLFDKDEKNPDVIPSNKGKLIFILRFKKKHNDKVTKSETFNATIENFPLHKTK